MRIFSEALEQLVNMHMADAERRNRGTCWVDLAAMAFALRKAATQVETNAARWLDQSGDDAA